jgi:hypothetical protein
MKTLQCLCEMLRTSAEHHTELCMPDAKLFVIAVVYKLTTGLHRSVSCLYEEFLHGVSDQ